MDISVTIAVIRILGAALIGGLLGIQRESVGKAAGIRTYALVALGSCLFTIISTIGFASGVYDPSRIASQVVVGIGFLGAGLILHHGTKIEGLTTAAGLWAAAGVGMAIGAGLWTIATITAILVALFFMLREDHVLGFLRRWRGEKSDTIDK